MKKRTWERGSAFVRETVGGKESITASGALGKNTLFGTVRQWDTVRIIISETVENGTALVAVRQCGRNIIIRSETVESKTKLVAVIQCERDRILYSETIHFLEAAI